MCAKIPKWNNNTQWYEQLGARWQFGFTVVHVFPSDFEFSPGFMKVGLYLGSWQEVLWWTVFLAVVERGCHCSGVCVP